jgi:phenylpropionate dioxygenase-like ring-hydroxylating dioxygenase large terminal subunit
MSVSLPIPDTLTGPDRQRAAMRDMQRRMVAHIAAGQTTDLADEPMAVSAGVYADPARAEAERRALFLKLPMVAGLSCDLPEPGDIMTFDALGPSILIMRGKDGALRAFLNACRHRAARLVKDCAHATRVTCPFHGWTYNLEGKLIGLPGKIAFDGLDTETLSLLALPIREWHGLILVSADPDGGPIDAEAFFGPMAAEIRQLDLARLVPVKKHVEPVAANWKFAQDTFFEGYHFNTLHPTTIAAAAYGNVTVHDAFGPHQRVMMPYRFFQDWVGQPESEWGEVPYQGIHLLFPNTILYVGNLESLVKDKEDLTDRQIFGFWRGFPGETPDSSFTMMATYRPASQSTPETVAEYEQLTDFIIKVIATEDYALCADGQKNLNRLPRDHKLYFGRNESSLQSIHQHIGQLLDAEMTSA